MSERPDFMDEREPAERSLRLILDSVPAAIAYFDAQTYIGYANRVYENLFQRGAAEIIGRGLREVLGDEVWNLVAPHVARVLAGEEVIFRRPHTWQDGRSGYLLVHYVPDRASSGRVVGFYALAQEVTELERAQIALRLSEAEFRAAFEQAAVGMALRGLDGRWLKVNQKLCDMLGYTGEELLRTTSVDLTHEDERETAAAFNERMARGELSIYSREKRYVRKDGSILWVEQSVSAVIGPEGKPSHLISVIADLTDRKRAEQALRESEARFRAIFEHANAGIAIYAPEGRFLAVNRAFAELVGWSEDELLRDMSFKELRCPGDTEAAENLRRLLAGDLEYSLRDRCFLRKDGTQVWGRLSVAPVRDAQGRPQYFVAIATDITETRLARERMERLNVELEERVAERTAELQTLVNELNAFNYSISHDLRAPLRAINGFANILREDETARLSAEGAHLLARIAQNAERMGELIDGLLEFSRLGRRSVQKAAVPMRSVLDEAMAGLDRGEARIEIGELPDHEGDPVLVKQVWANLVSNAIKYSRGRNPPRVEIGYDRPAGAYYVRDNGIGFEMQYAGKLFGVFQRLHNDPAIEGTGVGLAIVERIVRRHGGRVWAEGRPGEGATFYFTL